MIAAALVGGAPINATAQQPLFIWGTVKWNTGTPASGLEVRLVREGKIRALSYTNQSGRYGFFGVEGNRIEPSEYKLVVVTGSTVLNETPLRGIRIGGRAPDIEVR